MRSLYEKLNRLDDSLVESKRVVKKKKLTESVEDDKKKLFDAAASVKCKLDNDTIEYAMYDVDDFIENELVYCGKLLLAECPDLMFWTFGSDSDFGSYCEVYETDDEFPDAFYQISHDRVYDITDEINGEYDDIDEMLTEAIKDTDYVIAYVHPVSTFSKRYSFLGSNYRMTKDLDKAMTYTSKFSAEDEVKYAKDEVERIVDSSTPTGYASNFAADSDRFLVVTVAQARELLKNPDKKVSRAVSNNAEAQKAAKPVAKEIHEVIKKHNVSLSSFLMLIKELIKAEDPEA